MNEDTLGIGLYRGPAAIPDHLAPGQPPYPSDGYEGPPMADGIPGYQAMLDAIEKLGRAMTADGFEFISATVNGQTDSDGIVNLPVYQVSAGDEALMPRLTINALNPSTGVSYTPAVPYTNSGGYVKLFEAEGAAANDLGHTGLIDFGPSVPGAGFFPGLFESDSERSAPFVRGPNWYILRVVSGPASAQVFARYQVWKRRMRGMS